MVQSVVGEGVGTMVLLLVILAVSFPTSCKGVADGHSLLTPIMAGLAAAVAVAAGMGAPGHLNPCVTGALAVANWKGPVSLLPIMPQLLGSVIALLLFVLVHGGKVPLATNGVCFV